MQPKDYLPFLICKWISTMARERNDGEQAQSYFYLFIFYLSRERMDHWFI